MVSSPRLTSWSKFSLNISNCVFVSCNRNYGKKLYILAVYSLHIAKICLLLLKLQKHLELLHHSIQTLTTEILHLSLHQWIVESREMNYQINIFQEFQSHNIMFSQPLWPNFIFWIISQIFWWESSYLRISKHNQLLNAVFLGW